MIPDSKRGREDLFQAPLSFQQSNILETYESESPAKKQKVLNQTMQALGEQDQIIIDLTEEKFCPVPQLDADLVRKSILPHLYLSKNYYCNEYPTGKDYRVLACVSKFWANLILNNDIEWNTEHEYLKFQRQLQGMYITKLEQIVEFLSSAHLQGVDQNYTPKNLELSAYHKVTIFNYKLRGRFWDQNHQREYDRLQKPLRTFHRTVAFSVVNLSNWIDPIDNIIKKLVDTKVSLNIKHLIVNSTSLKILTDDWSHLETLECCYCEKLTKIPEVMLELTNLRCSESPILTALPREMPMIVKIDAYKCIGLTDLSENINRIFSLNISLTNIPKSCVSRLKQKPSILFHEVLSDVPKGPKVVLYPLQGEVKMIRTRANGVQVNGIPVNGTVDGVLVNGTLLVNRVVNGIPVNGIPVDGIINGERVEGILRDVVPVNKFLTRITEVYLPKMR